jgi:hypothetical protein
MRATRRLDQSVAQKEIIGLATGGDAMKARVGEKPEVDRPIKLRMSSCFGKSYGYNLGGQAHLCGLLPLPTDRIGAPPPKRD